MRPMLLTSLAIGATTLVALALAGCATDEPYRSPYEGSLSVPEGKAFAETPEERAERRARVRGGTADQ